MYRVVVEVVIKANAAPPDEAVERLTAAARAVARELSGTGVGPVVVGRWDAVQVVDAPELRVSQVG